MSNRVIYFSRSGKCKMVADKIAQELNCGTSEITDNVSWKGFFGFMRGGFYSLNQRLTQVTVEDGFEAKDADNIIFIVPLWAGGTAPAGYSYLKKEISNIKNLFMLICSDGTEATKAYAKLEEMVGPIKNKYGIVKSQHNETSVIKQICDAVSD